MFEGLTSKLDKAEKRIHYFEDMSTETSQTEKQKKKEWGKNGMEYP